MDLESELKHSQVTHAPRYSKDEVYEAVHALNIKYVEVDIMDFEPGIIKDYDCIIVSDSLEEKEDTEEEDIRFFKQCESVLKCAQYARIQNKKYVFLGDFGKLARNMAHLKI